ncbi:hypothetical protein MIDIC_10060 [Alphaproteobacteria bacterium]
MGPKTFFEEMRDQKVQDVSQDIANNASFENKNSVAQSSQGTGVTNQAQEVLDTQNSSKHDLAGKYQTFVPGKGEPKSIVDDIRSHIKDTSQKSNNKRVI